VVSNKQTKELEICNGCLRKNIWKWY
jgi:hypothetical protein